MMAKACSAPPSQAAIELAVNLGAALDGLLTHLARLDALEFDLMIGTKGFEHRIEALTGPWHQLTKLVDSHPIVALAEAVLGGLKLPMLCLRF